MGKKCTQAQMQQRVNQVIKMLLRSVSHKDIVRYAADKWGIKYRQTDAIISKANKYIYSSGKSSYNIRSIWL